MTKSVLPSTNRSPFQDSKNREECDYVDEFAWNEEYLTPEIFASLVVIIIFNSICAFFTVILNAVVITAVSTKWQIRTKSNVLLACLAGTDLSVGVVVQPLFIAAATKHVLGTGPYCPLDSAVEIVIIGVGFASFNHLVLITANRYIAIRYPLRYKDIVNPKRIKIAVVVAWAISVLVIIQETLLAVVNSDTNIFSFLLKLTDAVSALVASAFIFVIIYANGYIFSETRRQKRRIQLEQLPQEEVRRIIKNRKAANTLTIILVVLLLSYLPIIVLVLVTASTDDVAEPHVLFVLSNWAVTLAFLNSLFNPVIYCWRVKKLRHAFQQLLHLPQPQNRNSIEMIEIPQPSSV